MTTLAIALCATLLTSTTVLAQTPLSRAQLFERARSGLVAVRGRGCGPCTATEEQGYRGCPESNGNGAVIGDGRTVLTVRHLIADCRLVEVAGVRADGTREPVLVRTTVAHTLASADLALLELPRPLAERTPWSNAENGPSAGGALLQVGFEGASSVVSDLVLTVRTEPSILFGLLGNGTRESQEIVRAGSPSIDMAIVPLENSLLPGSSGSPLVDSQGRLVALAQGGLDDGRVGRSWAVPIARYLAGLRASTEPLPNPSRRRDPAAGLFARVQIEVSGDAVQCGQMSLQRVRTNVPFSRIAPYAPDQARMVWVLREYGNPTLTTQTSYDVWYDRNVGASVAVVANSTLEEVNAEHCRVRSQNGGAALYVYGQRIPNEAGVLSADLVFQRILWRGELGWDRVQGDTATPPQGELHERTRWAMPPPEDQVESPSLGSPELGGSSGWNRFVSPSWYLAIGVRVDWPDGTEFCSRSNPPERVRGLCERQRAEVRWYHQQLPTIFFTEIPD